ncbi:hypothetical protein GGR08_000569 [Bartonella fuyuanensis]|uniref:Uncharacterized protein n=1 Tax=Bartonella fuyuanensis TaxID=1460968 RepID=A0A840E549_9HYPH|nr:hypothetical protein [Bartonella fuyuanensis]
MVIALVLVGACGEKRVMNGVVYYEYTGSEDSCG